MKYIPNSITCLNLAAGFAATVSALAYGNCELAFLFILIAAVFDFLDGFAARLLNARSEIGLQLDSLSDIVSFGVAPAAMIFIQTGSCHISWIAILLPVFSALRLARFNVSGSGSDTFTGLPVPANALFWSSLITSDVVDGEWFKAALPLIVALSSWLLVSPIKMYSLKISNVSWSKSRAQYIIAFASLVLIPVFLLSGLGFAGISASIVFYILYSVIFLR
jgi:CDP-diacylglycerol--serine O-phosphatidyltransferase